MTDELTKTAVHTRKLSSVVAEDRERRKGEDGITKRSTNLHTGKLAGSEDGADAAVGVTSPTSEQLAAINQFTLSPKTADQVAVFNTMSCNDLEDRDEDKFTTETVRAFAELSAPYGPNGKSYMVGHDYKKLPVGRIFESATKEVDGNLFMTNGVYIPNTPQYQDFLENQDFGIYWAVSVGVLLDAYECSICAAPMSNWYGGCYEGHDKGVYYTADDARDKYDWPIPAEEGAKGAMKCIGLMKGARDFYELSQVFLGAQFYAELSNKGGKLAGAVKAAGQRRVPIIGLSAKEAAELPTFEVDPRVSEALRKYNVEHDTDGDMRWTDAEGKRWCFSAGELNYLGRDKIQVEEKGGGTDAGNRDQQQGREERGQSVDVAQRAADGEQPDSLGRSGDGADEPRARLRQPDHDGQRPLGDLTTALAAARAKVLRLRTAAAEGEDTESAVAVLDAVDETLDELEPVLAEDASDEALAGVEASLSDLAATLGAEDEETDDVVTDDDDEDDKDDGEDSEDEDSDAEKAVKKVSKKQVLSAALKAGVPTSILTKVSEAKDSGLTELVSGLVGTNKGLEAEVAKLAPLAESGTKYLESVRDEARDWYVRANADGNKGVKIDTFDKVLAACGDDVELIKELRDEQEASARKRFGVPVVRSTVDKDPNVTSELDGLSANPSEVKGGTDARVRKLHG